VRGGRRTYGWFFPFFLLVCALATSPLLAQRFRVRTYSEGEGLPSSAVWDVTQDGSGLMWFATRSGIASYDGTRWRTYGPADGLSTLNQAMVVRGSGDDMWSLAGREPLRVFRLRDGSWTALPSPELTGLSEPNCLAVTAAGGRPLIAAGTSNGLYLWDGEWTRLDETDGLPGADVRAVAALGDRLFVGTTTGLASVADGVVTDLTGRMADVPSPGTYGLTVSPVDGTLWLAGDSWLGRWSSDDRFNLETRLDEPLVLGYFSPRLALDADVHGGVYYGNPSILRYYHPLEGMTTVDPISGTLTTGATSVFVDREGNAWVSGLRGVSKIVSRRFVTLRQEHGLLEDEVTAILERRDGSFVLGHPNGISIMTDDGVRQVRFDFDREDRDAWVRVLDLEEDRDGAVWIAASHRGLARIDVHGNLEWRTGDRGLPGFASTVRQDLSGRIWATVNGVGLFHREGDRFELVHDAPGMNLRRLFRSGSGGLYVATALNGVGRIEAGKFSWMAVGSTPEENNVYAVLEHPDGQTFVGTEAGLRVIDGASLQLPSDERLRVGRPVYSLVLDGEGRLWCGTDNGVVRWNGTEVRTYQVEQGLAGRETNRAALVLDSRGRMWIGTGNGVSIYRATWDPIEPAAPTVRVESVLAGGELYSLESDVSLSAHDHDLTFEIRALSFLDEDRILLRSRLEGLDDNWNVAGGRSHRELRFPYLPAGRYRLHLQAENVDGARSAVHQTAWITIAPPFFQRPAVVLIAALLGALLLYFPYRYLAQRRYAKELETEVARRTERIRKVEEELTRSRRFESLASFAGGVAHDFNNLLAVILGQLALLRSRVDDDRPVERALDAVDQATKLTGQFLTFARGGTPVPRVLKIEGIVREAADLVLAGTNVQCVFEVAEDLPCVEVDPSQIAQVFNNLLLNAAQAMPDGGRVTVSLSRLDDLPDRNGSNRALRVSIQDEGPGIAPHAADRIFEPFFTTKEDGQGLGLASAYSIVNRHGGLLEAVPTTGTGARFDVTLTATEERPGARPDPQPAPAPGTGRILVMDDDDDVRAVLSVMLEESGYSVDETRDGKAAIGRYVGAMEVGEPFDAVILDLTVRGGMGGIEAIAQLREIDPGVRAIVISGYSEDPVMADHEGYGFRAAIAKPFSPDKLAHVLARVLATGPHVG